MSLSASMRLCVCLVCVCVCVCVTYRGRLPNAMSAVLVEILKSARVDVCVCGCVWMCVNVCGCTCVRYTCAFVNSKTHIPFHSHSL